MDHYVYCFMAIAISVGGTCMVIWPRAVVEQDRDADEKSSPPSPDEIWQMRVLGVIIIAAGFFMLYAILSGMPGAEFNGV